MNGKATVLNLIDDCPWFITPFKFFINVYITIIAYADHVRNLIFVFSWEKWEYFNQYSNPAEGYPQNNISIPDTGLFYKEVTYDIWK